MSKSLLLLLMIISVPLLAQEKEKGKLGIFEDEASGESDRSGDDEEILGVILDGADECDACGEGVLHGILNFARFMVYSEDFDKYFSDNHYTPYPYYQSNLGLFEQDTEKNFSLVFSSAYFHHSDQLNGFIVNADLSPHPMFGFTLKYADLTETLRTRYDHLRLYDIFITYNRLRAEQVVFSWGLGLKGMRGDTNLTAPAFSTGLEVFPVSPVSFSFHYNIGYYPGATVDDIAVNVNMHFERYRFRIGYQNFRAGRMSIGGLSLGIGIYL